MTDQNISEFFLEIYYEEAAERNFLFFFSNIFLLKISGLKFEFGPYIFVRQHSTYKTATTLKLQTLIQYLHVNITYE